MAQEVFERIEKKYLIPETVFRRLLPELRKHMADDVYGRYTISNIYFDTEQFDLIRASLEKPVYKEKLRLRCYGTPSEDGKVFVEIKKKYKGIAKSDEDVLSIALFGDVALKFIEKRNADGSPTVIHVEA